MATKPIARKPLGLAGFAAALCITLLLAGCAASASAPAAATPTPKQVQAALDKPIYLVQRGLVVDELKLSGHTAAIKQQDLSFTFDGHLKTLYVDRTSVITEGQLLAELDLGDLPNQFQQAQVAYDQAQRELDRAQADRQLAAQRAQLDLDEAREQLATLQQPPKAAELAQARAAVQSALATLDETRSAASAAKTRAELQLRQASAALPPIQSDYATALERWRQVDGSPNDPHWASYHDQYLRADSALRSAESLVAQAQIEYDAARAGESPAIRQAEAAVSAAQARLDALGAGPDSAALAAARRSIERAALAQQAARQSGDPELDQRLATAQLDLERIQAKLDAGRIYAPFSGKVAAIGARPGDTVAAYKAVISVMDAAALELIVENVSALDAAKIGVGQPAQISFARYRGKTFTGTVVALPTSQVSSSSTVNEDTAYHLSYDAAGNPLDVGDIAEVTITLAKKDDALWLPPQAVRAFDGRRFVVVKDGDRQRRQDVKVGIVGADRVEILDGLQLGEQVVGQ